MIIKKVKEKIRHITNGYVKQEHGWKLNTLFRARKNLPNQSFNKIEDMLEPPSSIVKCFGRLNSPGESVFYAAEVRDDTLHEIKSKPGDVVTIAQFDPLESIKLDLIVFAVFETKCAREIGFSKLTNPLRKVKKKIHTEDFPKQTLISEFIVNEMTKEISSGFEYQYKVCAAIAEVLWKDTSMFDLVSYPSVTKKLKGLNIGIFPLAQPPKTWS